MRLEDSLLYLVLDIATDSDIAEFCSAAIAGGVDVIHMPSVMASDNELLKSVRDICLRDDALFVVAEDAVLAMGVAADGVHLSSPNDSVGQVRAMIGVNDLVGISTKEANEAVLALEVGADYLLHWAGVGCPAAFSGLPMAAGSVLFAAGIASHEDARAVVAGGIYRLCVGAKLLADGDVTENAAAFSRILGRSI